MLHSRPGEFEPRALRCNSVVSFVIEFLVGWVKVVVVNIELYRNLSFRKVGGLNDAH